MQIVKIQPGYNKTNEKIFSLTDGFGFDKTLSIIYMQIQLLHTQILHITKCAKQQ